MADLAEALKARIKGMSAGEPEAEAGRRSLGVPAGDTVEIEALWEQTVGDSTTAASRTVAVRVDAGSAGSPDTMTLSQGSTFSETMTLTPPVYRLLAGGHAEDGERSSALAERFVISPGKPGFEKVSTARETLAEHVELERPLDMARAHRLLELERLRPATLRLPVAKRTALFVERWMVEDVDSRIDAAVCAVSSRTILLMAGRDQVALRLRREDLAGDCRLLQPDLASAILRPTAAAVTQSPLVPFRFERQEADPYFSSTHGNGMDRVLILDLARFRKAVQTLKAEEDRNTAVAALAEMASRSANLGRECLARSRRSETNHRVVNA